MFIYKMEILNNFNTKIKIYTSSPALIFALQTFMNFARCSKCFVISVARIMSMTFCRNSLYASVSRF